ncbi:hypothetical protein ACF0H5_018678 [Mactra antiquata]
MGGAEETSRSLEEPVDVNDDQGTVDIIIETVQSEHKNNDDGDIDDDSMEGLSGEQLMKLNILYKLPEKSPMQLDKTHLITVVDNSGSMSGNPWKQVQEALLTLMGSSLNLKHIHTDFIVYNTSAQRVPINKDNYVRTIETLTTCGATSFVDAFNEVFDVIYESRNQFTSTVVVFLTDGQDTINRNKQQMDNLVPNLRERIARINEQVTIHTVGFSRDHAFQFLKQVSDNGGTVSGMFRYCEPGDDKTILLQKLEELFDFITYSEKTCNINIELLDENSSFVNQTKTPKNVTLKGKLAMQENQKSTITGETWIRLEPPTCLPNVKVSLELQERDADGKSNISLVIKGIERKKLTSSDDKSLWRLRILERNMDDLTDRVANAVSSKSDVASLQVRVEKYQKQISKTKVFGNGISKQLREVIFAVIKDIQKSLDEVQKMLADYLRSGTSELSLLARAHDMRYQAVFNKSRRQRVMDQRVSKNIQQATIAQQQLTSLTVNKVEINNLSQDAQGFFYCILSQNSVRDVLLGDDKDDAIGFGLAIQRSEVVLDEPTLVRLHVISGTLVSRHAMLDALEYKINVSSHLKAHGGFTFKDSELGVTTIGISREPINAWLPLYITPSHWERIKVILKPCLGYFCTLDPLGYHYKQLDVIFTVLGAMIGQLSQYNIGEHQLRLLFSVLRTCTACLTDFDLETQVNECLVNFIASPAGRTKDVVPNLYTVVGYALALPLKTRKEIFKDEDTLQKFLLAIISEWLRRCAGTLYREESVVKLNGILNALIGTDSIDKSERLLDKHDAESELIRLCLNTNHEDINITPFDPSADLTEPDIDSTHSEHTDKAMEMWAEKMSGISENLDKTNRKAYQKALVEVNKWCQVGKTLKDDSAKNTENTDTEPSMEQVDCSEPVEAKRCMYVKETVVQVMAYIIKHLIKSSYPHVTSFPGLIAFTTRWLTSQYDALELDGNSGIAPGRLIEDIKMAMNEMFKNFDDKTSKEASVIGPPQNEVNIERQTNTNIDPPTNTVVDGVKTKHFDVDDDSVELDDTNNVDYEYGIGDDDGNYSDDVDSDDGDDTGSASMTRKKSNKGMDGFKVCLPKLLKIIDNNCDVVLLLQAMLCQSVRFHSNSKARAAIGSKEMLDTAADDSSVYTAILDINRKHLTELTVSAQQNMLNQVLWKRANQCMFHATTPLAFVGYLMNTYTSRHEGFPDLIDLFMTTVDTDVKPPALKEKIHIVLTGKYLDHPVFDNGNQWLPEKKMAKNFQKLLGDEIWGEYEAELRSSVNIHVYRESDIPNRHGHCNSNPYIPNSLRKRLGMALIKEKNNNRSRKKSK